MAKELSKDDITRIVRSEINSFIKDSIDTEMAKILKNQNSSSRGEMLTAMKKAMESAFKILWVKRDFWKTDIK